MILSREEIDNTCLAAVAAGILAAATSFDLKTYIEIRTAVYSVIGFEVWCECCHILDSMFEGKGC